MDFDQQRKEEKVIEQLVHWAKTNLVKTNPGEKYGRSVAVFNCGDRRYIEKLWRTH